jgi:hypothetical protein
MKRHPIPKEIFDELYRACIYGGPGSKYYKERIGPYALSEEQIAALIDHLNSSHSSALEYANAKEAIEFLQNLKNRK